MDDPNTNSLGGNFHNVLISNITIGERFRKDYGNIDALKSSITAYGLLEPIILDRENNLLAGGRRLNACTQLKHLRIPAQYLDEVDSVRAREVELEENIQRKDLTWDERADLIREIDELKSAKYAGQTKPARSTIPDDERTRALREAPAWTQDDTADLFGISQPAVHRGVALSHALEVMPELREADNESQAFKAIDRRIEELEREINFRRHQKAGTLNQTGQVLLGDCVELLKTIEPHSIDLVLIDPPYGVLEPGGTHRYESGVHFDDDPLNAMALLRDAAAELKRVMKDDAHAYVFFGIKMFVETLAIFTNAGFDVDPIPLVWVKTTGSIVDWDYRFSNYYEPILFISNKTRRLSRKSSNVFTCDSVPSSERSNVAEKPVELLQRLISLSTNTGDLVLDCFAGSGSTAVAAQSMNRRFIVIEKDEGQWKHIQNRLALYTSPAPSAPLLDLESNLTSSRPEPQP